MSGADLLLGKYRLLQRLGEGGMGTVFRAHDELIDRDVAIKQLRPDLVPTAALADRFRAEAVALARLAIPASPRCTGSSGTTTALHGHGVPAGRHAGGALPAAGRLPWRARRRALRRACSTRWSTRTSAASCIATSSRPTSWSRPTAG